MIHGIPIELPKVIGHRGACHYAPENTLASLHKAAEIGATWVEFDVTLTKDAVPVIFHDKKLSRTTNGRGKLSETNYADIIKLDAGSWFSSEFAGQVVPSLADYLNSAYQLGLGINIELKPSLGREIETATLTAQTLEQHWPANHGKCMISSFSVACIDAVRCIDKEIPVGLLVKSWDCDWQEMLAEYNCTALIAYYDMLSPEVIAEGKTLTQYVLSHTVDDVDAAKQYFEWGVDGLFSNRPDVILKTTRTTP